MNIYENTIPFKNHIAVQNNVPPALPEIATNVRKVMMITKNSKKSIFI